MTADLKVNFVCFGEKNDQHLALVPMSRCRYTINFIFMFGFHFSSFTFRDSLNNVLDLDPGSSGSAKGLYPMVYKCKKCRRTLATSHNLMPHVEGEEANWKDPKWSLPAEEILEGASDLGLKLCSGSLFINPIEWMKAEIKQNLSGNHCNLSLSHCYPWTLLLGHSLPMATIYNSHLIPETYITYFLDL